MKEYNVNSLIANIQVIKIKDDDGNVAKEIKFRKLSAARTFEIAEKYNKLMEQNKEVVDEKDIGKSQRLFGDILDICFGIVRPLKFIDRLKNRFSKNYISKKWLLENFDIDGLNEFITSVLEPIQGKVEKKT